MKIIRVAVLVSASVLLSGFDSDAGFINTGAALT